MPFGNVLIFWNHQLFAFVESLFPQKRKDRHFCYEIKKNQFNLHNWQSFSLRNMATSRNKRKRATVSRETSEKTRNSQSKNKLDPGMAQQYISQVSEEIDGRVTKKLSKEHSRMDSRILGASSKLDEFLLNPQVWTCFVAVPGTSRNNNSEKREPTSDDRSLGNPCAQAAFSACHSSSLNYSEQEENHHMLTGVEEEIPYCSLELRQESKRRRFPQVSHSFPVRTPLRQLKQTRFC